MITRKVMMPDGIARTNHSITAINHLIGVRTVIDIVSTTSDEEDLPYVWKHVIIPYDTTITESDAYDIVSNLDKMVEYHDPIDDILPILTDEQAELVASLYPDWAADVSYTVGMRVLYNNKLYRCVQAHTSQVGWEPNQTPSLWVRTAQDDEIPEWIQPVGAADAYNTGDKVTHNGSTWISTADSNVWEPGVYGWDIVE